MYMKPFTYHLYHKPTGQHYYGVRYKKGCSPDELWVSYFSSSPIVHQLIEQYGKDSFVPTVRKVFKSVNEAILYETRFLTKVNAQNNTKWLNRHNGRADFVGPHSHSEISKEKIRSKIKGIKRSEETKAKMRIKAKERESKRRAEGWQYPTDAQIKASATRKARIQTGEINPYSEERNRKMSNSKKGTKRKYLPDGSFIMVKL